MQQNQRPRSLFVVQLGSAKRFIALQALMDASLHFGFPFWRQHFIPFSEPRRQMFPIVGIHNSRHLYVSPTNR